MFAMILWTLAGLSAQAAIGRLPGEPQSERIDSFFEAVPTGGPGLRTALPPPTMPDGLNAARQRVVIASLIRDEYSFEDFTRRSTVAPQRLKIRKVTPADDRAPAHSVDVWFVAYDDKAVGGLASAFRGMRIGKPLTKEHLKKRGIEAASGKREVYRHGCEATAPRFSSGKTAFTSLEKGVGRRTSQLKRLALRIMTKLLGFFPGDVSITAFGDGSVRALNKSITKKLLHALITASGGEDDKE